MNKNELIKSSNEFLKSEYELRKNIRHYLSELLKDTDEDNPKHVQIKIDDDKYFGISYLEIPCVTSCWFVPDEESIYFELEGYFHPIDFDDMTTSELITIFEGIS